MKPVLKCVSLFILGFLVLAPALSAYDLSPQRRNFIPEVIWAPATGGGTWVSEIQITAKAAGTQITVSYYHSGGYRLVTLGAPTTENYETRRYTNILSTLNALDAGFSYYGTVGTLMVNSQGDAYPIWMQAMTRNGNYGKTYPGFPWVDANTANLGRLMAIPNIKQSATYRTFVGFWNGIAGGYSMTVNFFVMYPGSYSAAGWFTKTFSPWQFMSFNPFAEAGLTGTYTNNWLLIIPQTSGSSGADSRGLACFGSIANNYTNDTYALIAIPRD